MEKKSHMHELPGEQKAGWSWRLRVAGTFLSLVLLVWLLWRQDWEVILSAVKGFSLWILFVSIGLLVVRHTWNTTRWFILVRAQQIPIPFSRALKLVFIGLFASNFLPSMVGGDVVRMAGIFQDSDNRVAGAASIVVDRVVGVIGMLFVLPLSVPLIKLIFSEGIFFGGILGIPYAKWVQPIREGFQKVLASLKVWLSQPGWLFLALCVSWMGVLTYVIAVVILAKELGIPVTLTDVAGATALTYFLTMVPLSINGYGIRELAILSFYTHFGATSEQATLLALITRFMFLLVSLPGSLWVGDVLRNEPKLMQSFEKDIE